MKEHTKELIVVLSGNEKSSSNRIKKGIELSLAKKDVKKDVYLLFNGFNTAKEHEPYFKGNWQNDTRLNQYMDAIKHLIDHGINVDVVYARNTGENAAKTLEYVLKKNKKYDKIYIVTDDWHSIRAELCYYAFFGPKYNEIIEFYPVKNNLKEKIKNMIKQFPYFIASYYALLKVKKKKPETVKNYNIRLNLRKYFLNFKSSPILHY